MTVDGTQPTDQSSRRLSPQEADRKAWEAGRDARAATSLANQLSTWSVFFGSVDPKFATNMPQNSQGLMAMMGPLLQSFTGFLQNMGVPGQTTPNAPGNTSPQVTTTQPQTLVMSQNFAPRGPTGMA